MFNFRIWALLKRELKERVMTKSFIIGTIAVPVLIIALIGIQYLMFSMEGDAGTKIEITTHNESLIQDLKKAFAEKSWVKNGDYTITYTNLKEKPFDPFFKERKPVILKNEITGILHIPNSAFKDKVVTYYSKSAKNMTVERKMAWVINQVFIDRYFKDKPVSLDDIKFARANVNFNSFKVTKEDKLQKSSEGNLILAYLLSFLLYMALLIMGSSIMNSVIEEKTNRVCEVVLSSVNSRELMSGKIFGASLTGLLQMFVWLLPIMIILIFNINVLPAHITLHINATLFPYFMLNFFLGLLTFVGLYAVVGSMFNTAQETQAAATPLMMLIIIPFLISISMMNNPTNILAKISSLLPFAAIMVMPARMSLVDVPLWEVLLSLAVNIGVIIALFPLAGKIYRIGILRTGKKPTLIEFINWLKAKDI